MTYLAVVYASAPSAEVIIPTLELSPPGDEPIRICNGFEDQTVTLETDQLATFQAGPVEVGLPARNTSGQQRLTFGVANVTGFAQQAVERSLESGARVPVVYREYLHSDLSAPAARPIRMVLTGGVFEGIQLQLTAAYYDLLNTAWPRDRYTAEFAPGLKYFN